MINFLIFFFCFFKVLLDLQCFSSSGLLNIIQKVTFFWCNNGKDPILHFLDEKSKLVFLF
jgi:hypothetical protein